MSHAFPQRNVQHVPFALEVTSQHYTAKFTVSLLDEADILPSKPAQLFAESSLFLSMEENHLQVTFTKQRLSR